MRHPGRVESPIRTATATHRVNPSGLIYGVLTVATVVAAEATKKETYPKLLIAATVALALYWLAHAYSAYWGLRIEHRGGGDVRGLLRAMVAEAPILIGAMGPGLVLLVAWAAGATLETGVTAALWCSVAEIVLLEILAGLYSRLSLRNLAVQTATGAVMGVGILVLRVVLH